MKNNPIAVIDSGAGGLASLPEIRKAMPHEDIIYFGDTINVPYGEKTADEVIGFARDIAKFVTENGAKMILIACGTMSSVALDMLYKEFPMTIVQDIVSPGIAATSRVCTNESRVGVIATPTTIASNSYPNGFARLTKQFKYFTKACPKLATLIESGVTEGPELEALLKEYIDPLVEEDKIDTLVMACTHYPLVEGVIAKLYPQLKLVNPVSVMGRAANSMLVVHDMDNCQEEPGSVYVYVSKLTDSFKNFADKLIPDGYEIEEVSIHE